jgi:hypothetical protein
LQLSCLANPTKLASTSIFLTKVMKEAQQEEQQQNKQTVKELLSCYHVHEDAPKEDDLCDI